MHATTAAAMSDGGMSGKPTASNRSRAPLMSGVSVRPGQTQFTVMRCSASVGATLRTRPTTPCFVSA